MCIYNEVWIVDRGEAGLEVSALPLLQSGHVRDLSDEARWLGDWRCWSLRPSRCSHFEFSDLGQGVGLKGVVINTSLPDTSDVSSGKVFAIPTKAEYIGEAMDSCAGFIRVVSS